jgi:Peptidase propeptide and YPEB domain
MQLNRKVVAIAAGATVLAAGGVGIAYAVSGGEEQVTGPSAEKAKAAALKAVGGGTVLEIEQQDGDGAGAYEVEVKRPNGSTVEVYIDNQFGPAGSAADDDRGGESEDEGEGEED